jgi:hypothetical protein
MNDEPEFEKLPGYFRPWDLAQVVLAGRTYRLEDVGVMADGGALFAVYVALQQVLG